MIELDIAWILVDAPLYDIVAARLKQQAEVDFVLRDVQPVLHEVVERVAEGLGNQADVPLLQRMGWKIGKADLPFLPAKSHTVKQHTGPASVAR